MRDQYPPVALSIAGSDPSGGAGIQADLKSFSARGVYGTAVITALTAQNTRRVTGVMGVEPAFIREQLRTLFDDIRPDAIKIGMVGTAGIAAAVADGLEGYTGPVVVDPVMVATSGSVLLEPAAEATLTRRLVPRATLVTPNIPEAARLLGAESPASWTARTDAMSFAAFAASTAHTALTGRADIDVAVFALALFATSALVEGESRVQPCPRPS